MLFQRGKSYSPDLRERVFAAAGDGRKVGQIAQGLRVSVSYGSKVLSRRAKTGETTARPQCGHVRPKLADLHAAIRQQVTTRPDATLPNCVPGCSRPTTSRRARDCCAKRWPNSA